MEVKVLDGPTTGIKTEAAKARQYPRIGKIKIGIKGTSSGGKEIPKSVDYFVPTGNYTEEFRKVYGDKPTEITIVFPPAPDGDISQIINHFYRSYKGSKLYCFGDGVKAMRSDGKGKLEPRECPCELLNNEKKSCTERLRMSFIIPNIPILGVWEFSTGSLHSRINVFSGIDLTNAFSGNIVGIPFTLSVEMRTGAISGSQNKFPVINITPQATTQQLLQMEAMDPKERFNCMLMGKELPQIEEKKTAALPEPEESLPETTEETPPPESDGSDLTIGELKNLIAQHLQGKPDAAKLKIKYLGVESLGDCDNEDDLRTLLAYLTE